MPRCRSREYALAMPLPRQRVDVPDMLSPIDPILKDGHPVTSVLTRAGLHQASRL